MLVSDRMRFAPFHTAIASGTQIAVTSLRRLLRARLLLPVYVGPRETRPAILPLRRFRCHGAP
jgi:hypothetical protein